MYINRFKYPIIQNNDNKTYLFDIDGKLLKMYERQKDEVLIHYYSDNTFKLKSKIQYKGNIIEKYIIDKNEYHIKYLLVGTNIENIDKTNKYVHIDYENEHIYQIIENYKLENKNIRYLFIYDDMNLLNKIYKFVNDYLTDELKFEYYDYDNLISKITHHSKDLNLEQSTTLIYDSDNNLSYSFSDNGDHEYEYSLNDIKIIK